MKHPHAEPEACTTRGVKGGGTPPWNAGQLRKACRLAARPGAVVPFADGMGAVVQGNGGEYVVRFPDGVHGPRFQCTCPHGTGRWRKKACYHVPAALLVLAGTVDGLDLVGSVDGTIPYFAGGGSVKPRKKPAMGPGTPGTPGYDDTGNPVHRFSRIDGFSVSAWKSLAVKAVRMGWPEGIRQAEVRLPKGWIRSLLMVQMFEDVFPAVDELREAVREVERGDYEALCARETHHGREGMTAEFDRLKDEACPAAEERKSDIWGWARALGLKSLPPRGLNVFYTWHVLQPEDSGQSREVDTTPWQGMLDAALDGHTAEGRARKRDALILSGHYHQHVWISEFVGAHGWEPLRRAAHSLVLPAPDRKGGVARPPSPPCSCTSGHEGGRADQGLLFEPEGWSGGEAT